MMNDFIASTSLSLKYTLIVHLSKDMPFRMLEDIEGISISACLQCSSLSVLFR